MVRTAEDERRDATARTLALLALVVLVSIVALVGMIRILTNDEVVPVHTVDGVTWQGDECRVLDDLGVIVCRGPIG